MSEFSDRLDYELESINYEGDFDRIIKRNKAHSKKLKTSLLTSAMAIIAVFGITFSTQLGNIFTSSKSGNGFILSVNAAEVTADKPASLQFSESSLTMSENEDGNISYIIPLNLKCEGENINTVTYSVDKGALSVNTDLDNNTHSSLTVNYDNQLADNMTISIVGISEDFQDSTHKNALFFGTLEETKQHTDKLLDGATITCTVKYKNGEEQSQKIQMGTEIMKMSEAFPEEKEKLKELSPEEQAIKDAEDVFITFKLVE